MKSTANPPANPPASPPANPPANPAADRSGSALTAVVVGASGLVGKQLLHLLLADERYSKVLVLVRKTLGIKHTRLVEQIIRFETLEQIELPQCNHAFCCLGTTIKDAGSNDAFRRVDHDYVVAFAKIARRAGARHLLLVSTMGANPQSSVFYSRVKGEVEAAVQQLGYTRVSIMRPSMLTGNRSQSRSGEKIALAVLSPVSWLIPAKYRPVSDLAVATALINASAREQPGVEVIESDQIQRLTKQVKN